MLTVSGRYLQLDGLVAEKLVAAKFAEAKLAAENAAAVKLAAENAAAVEKATIDAAAKKKTEKTLEEVMKAIAEVKLAVAQVIKAAAASAMANVLKSKPAPGKLLGLITPPLV